MKGASFVEHIGNHQKGDQAEDKVGLKLMTAFVPFGSFYGALEHGPDTGNQHDQFEDIFERAVEPAKPSVHERMEKGNVQPLAHQINRAEPKDHKSPENHNMQDTCPEVAGLFLLNKAVGNEIEQSLSNGGKPRINLP